MYIPKLPILLFFRGKISQAFWDVVQKHKKGNYSFSSAIPQKNKQFFKVTIKLAKHTQGPKKYRNFIRTKRHKKINSHLLNNILLFSI